MKEMIENIKSDKKKLKIVIGGVIAAIIIIILIILLIVGVLNKKDSPNKKVEEAMTAMAKDFYENFYYPNLEGGNEAKRTDFLSKFEKIGIKVNFDNLSRYNTKENEKYIKVLEKYECDKNETRVIIKPTTGYKKDNYTITVETSCNFDKKDKKK